MNKADFADVEASPRWWLIEDELAYPLVEPRQDLAEALGFERTDTRWYQEKAELEELFDLLEANGTLVTDVDALNEDNARKEWLDKVVALVRQVKAGGDEADEESNTPAGTAPTAETAPADEAPTDTTSSGGPAGTAPAPKPSMFAKKRAAEAAESAVQEVVAAVTLDNAEALANELGVTPAQMEELIQQLPDNFAELVRDRVKQLSGA